jgi:hypothetical protein
MFPVFRTKWSLPKKIVNRLPTSFFFATFNAIVVIFPYSCFVRILTTLVVLSFAFLSGAQNTQPRYSLGYFGHNLVQPGLHLGIGFETTTKEKTRKKWIGKKEKTISKTKYLEPQINLYHHLLKETNLTVGSEYLFERMKVGNKVNFSQGFGLGVFYMRSWNAGETYDVIDGVVSQIPFAGTNYFAPSLSYKAQFGILQKSNTPISVFVKPMVFLMMPYNQTVVPNINMVFGCSFPLSFKSAS